MAPKLVAVIYAVNAALASRLCWSLLLLGGTPIVLMSAQRSVRMGRTSLHNHTSPLRPTPELPLLRNPTALGSALPAGDADGPRQGSRRPLWSGGTVWIWLFSQVCSMLTP